EKYLAIALFSSAHALSLAVYFSCGDDRFFSLLGRENNRIYRGMPQIQQPGTNPQGFTSKNFTLLVVRARLHYGVDRN
ncbi:hypothetical protein Taro_033312, partial [Colocasia esculenta]|nr:hypothetical protein [Colocasia esculenta]